MDYARAPLHAYLKRYGAAPKEVLLLGMNPGPFGMAQTGIPFGEVAHVRDWLNVAGRVARPPREHTKRPVQGFACARSEVSGRRLWGWAAAHAGTPEVFFARFFVWNYCPLAFMGETGRNITPDKLPAVERDALYAVCDRALGQLVRALAPRYALGVGGFAEQRLRAVLGPETPLRIGRMPHPSPASPAANRGWAEAADAALARLGIAPPG